MRIPNDVARLYAHAGPFATAYLDVTRATERGPKEMRPQWQALRGELSAAGADEATLTSLDAAVDDDWTPGEHGQVLVGAGGETLLKAALPKARIRPRARWAPLPHVMPYLAQLGPRIAHVVVVADRAGADVLAATGEVASAASPSEPTYAEPHPVEGSPDDRPRSTSTVDWSARQFRLRIENTWAANVQEAAAEVARLVTRVGASLVILAGDGRASARLRAELPQALSPHVEVVDVTEGSRHNGGVRSAQIEAVHGVLLRRGLRERERRLERLRVAQTDHLVAQGLAPVIDALRRAQVDTLVLVDQPTSRVHCWVGPRATQFARRVEELKDLGVDSPQPDRLDAAMVRALAGTSAELLTVPPEDLSLPDSIAAVLRSADDARP